MEFLLGAGVFMFGVLTGVFITQIPRNENNVKESNEKDPYG